MGDYLRIDRFWAPAGEGNGTVAAGTHRLLLADSQAIGIEWSVNGSRKSGRDRVFSGDIWVWPQARTWWSRQESDQSWIQLSLSSAWLQQVTHSSADLLPQVQLRDSLLAQMLRTLADATAFPQNPTTALYCESLATTLVLHVVTHHAQTAEKRHGATPLPAVRLRIIANHIAERLAEPISLAELARLVGLSTSQFSLRFRATTGQTPYQFVTAMRVDRARELLLAGQHTLADVAMLTGFADQAHLTRHVRRAFGVTPGALKKR